jgi:hypothetical protein
MSKTYEMRNVVLITKLDKAAVEAEIAENGIAVVEPPQSEDCELEAVVGDLLFWSAEIEVSADDEEDDEDEDEDEED